MKDEGVTNEEIMSYLVGVHEFVIDMNERMATKDDLERLKEEIIDPSIKAVDKDAEIVYDHGKRITTVEKKVAAFSK